MNRQVEANLSMVVSKALGGLNMNALKYLLPLWIAPVTGVTFRLVFGAAAFWLIDIFCKPENSTIRQKWQLFILGALGIYGYMFFYLLGISKTTPVSSSIFVSLEPIWVFIISVLFYKEKVTWMKVLGIGMGFIYELIRLIGQHDCKMENIRQLFLRYSENIYVEEMRGEDFDVMIRFPEEMGDTYCYCFRDEGCHVIYHRFLPEDYADLMKA